MTPPHGGGVIPAKAGIQSIIRVRSTLYLHAPMRRYHRQANVDLSSIDLGRFQSTCCVLNTYQMLAEITPGQYIHQRGGRVFESIDDTFAVGNLAFA